MSADEHPQGDVRLGQAWMADVAQAFMASPNYRRGAMFIIYDEWGGFFDHVRPPSVPDARQSANLNEDFGQMGFRIPAVALSPFSRNHTGQRARVAHPLLGHESILKLITYRFRLGDLTTRDAQANNIGETFDWSSADFDPPDLPDPAQVVARPCAFGGGTVLETESVQNHLDDITALANLAAQHGVPTGNGKPEDIFTRPDTVRKGINNSPSPGAEGPPGTGLPDSYASGTSGRIRGRARRRKRSRRRRTRRKSS